MKRIVTVAFVVLFLACDTVPHHTLTLTFNDAGDRITIAADTTLPLLKDATDRARVEHLRDDLVAGRDQWALRFANANPEHDRVTFERTNGELAAVQRSATIDARDLQKFFFDLPISTTVTRGDGWVELAIYPGTSNRATRQERDDFDKRLQAGASAARRYFAAVRSLYAYLDEHPQRATDVFDAMFRDDDDPRPIVVTERELDHVKAVRDAITGITDLDWGGAAHEADVVFNPFPARIVVNVPGEPTLVEGFDRQDRALVIEPKQLLESIAALEGRWISPDPLALVLRQPKGAKEEDLVAELAGAKRRAEPVIGLDEVAQSIAEQLKPAGRYRVRFITKTRVD